MSSVPDFSKDPIEILRVLRNMASAGLPADRTLADAIHAGAALLRGLGGAPVRRELCALLCGESVLAVLLEYSDVITAVIPELRPCIGFEQHSKYHQYTVYDHIAHAVANDRGNDPVVKTALLLHDIGKPSCYVEDQRGGHFPRHGGASRTLAEPVVDRLDFSDREKQEILILIGCHSEVIEPLPEVVTQWLERLGPAQFSRLLAVRHADILAHTAETRQSRLVRCIALGELFAAEMKTKKIRGTPG